MKFKFLNFLSNWLVGMTTLVAVVGFLFLLKLISLIPNSGEIVMISLIVIGLPILFHKAFDHREQEGE
jgi:hypothetical protein